MANSTISTADLVSTQENGNAVFRNYVRQRMRMETAKQEVTDATSGYLMAKADFEKAQQALDEFVSRTVKAGGLGGE